jgi:hypothetical protein
MSEAAPEFVTIVHSGMCSKKGQKVKNWKQRWLVLLSNGVLRYFEDKLSFEESGHVDLDHTSVPFCSNTRLQPFSLTRAENI